MKLIRHLLVLETLTFILLVQEVSYYTMQTKTVVSLLALT